jgi:hypothetical protein
MSGAITRTCSRELSPASFIDFIQHPMKTEFGVVLKTKIGSRIKAFLLLQHKVAAVAQKKDDLTVY